VTKVLTRGMQRAIANPLNRALWWLTAGVSTLTLLTGAIPATYLYLNTFSVPISKVIIWFLVLNSITLAVLLTLLAIVLSRVSYPLIGARAVGVSVCVATVAALVRLTMVWLTRFSESAPTSDAGVAFYIVQLALSLMLIITLAITVSFASAYASNRERALSRAIADFDRSQASLVREEEVVRSAVFDHLHGTLQSEFVAMREALNTLAESAPGTETSRVASNVEQRLRVVYSDSIQSMAQGMHPRGLEAGLQIALSEMQTRLGVGMSLQVHIDPFLAAMDNPLTGGIHQSARLVAYRIIEEAASNALKHSQATEVLVVLGSQLVDGSVSLDIEVSNEISEAVVITEGTGLERMKMRARSLGGWADYASADGRFIVLASVPLALPKQK
jgi:signal transduction histidine kinase